MITSISSVDSAAGFDGGVLDTLQETRFGSTAKSADATSPKAADGPTFADLLGQVSMEAVERLKTGEAASIAAIEGKASTQQVIEAVLTAEASLQTALAIREKVVAAYQEISRMAI